jgi:hypothetical protein
MPDEKKKSTLISLEDMRALLEKGRTRHNYGKAIAEFMGEEYVEPPVVTPSRFQRIKANVSWKAHRTKLAWQVLKRGYHEDESDW